MLSIHIIKLRQFGMDLIAITESSYLNSIFALLFFLFFFEKNGDFLHETKITKKFFLQLNPRTTKTENSSVYKLNDNKAINYKSLLTKN